MKHHLFRPPLSIGCIIHFQTKMMRAYNAPAAFCAKHLIVLVAEQGDAPVTVRAITPRARVD